MKKIQAFKEKNHTEYIKFLETILDTIPIGIYCANGDGVGLFINKEAEIMDNINRDDILGKGKGEEGVWDTSFHRQVMSSQKTIDEVISYTKPPSTSVTFVHHSVHPFVVDGKIRGTFSLSKDITKEDQYISHIYRLQQELKIKEKKIQKNNTSYDLSSIIGQSIPLIYAIQTAQKAAQFQTNIMICGETGTGKELFAQGIHNASSFRDEPFIGVNCSAIPENLMESILFGSVKGAYTGAQNTIGLFEQAKHGTLFLDEIDSMSLSVQSKLLRVLQERRVRPIGGHKEIDFHCRIISATNQNLEATLKENIIRRDIYYRLSAIILKVPPLREREGDIPLLMHHFLDQCRYLYGSKLQEIEPAVYEIFSNYGWPGNVREMEHLIKGIAILAGENETVLSVHHIPANLLQDVYQSPKSKPIDLNMVIDDYERSLIVTALNGNHHNLSATARSLNIHRNALYSKMKRLGIK